MGDLLGVFFGTMFNSTIENPRPKLRGKLVRRIALVQKVCYASYRGLPHLVQLSNPR